MNHNLITFKDARIEALLKNQEQLKNRIQQLETFIFEVCDPTCPESYRQVVVSEVFKHIEEV
jgi:uncharacterized protein YutD